MTRGRPLRVAFTIGVQPSGGIRRTTLEIGACHLRSDDIDLVPIGSRANLDALYELAGTTAQSEVVVPASRGALEAPWTRYVLDARLAPMHVDLLHCLKQCVPRRSRVPVVLTVHDLLALDRPDDFGRAKAVMLPPLVRRSILGADRWIVDAESVAEDLIRRFDLPQNKVTTVVLGSSALADASPTPIAAVDGRFALVVGDLSPRKNVAYLARMWADVHEATGVQLLAAGPGGWRSDMAMNALESLERAGLGRWLGPVSDRELRWLYENAAVVCVPSVAEGYGLAAVEAASFGCPVVSSDIPSLRELDGLGSITMVPLSRPDQWVDAVTAAVHGESPPPVTSRTWEQVAEETAAVYEHLIWDKENGRSPVA